MKKNICDFNLEELIREIALLGQAPHRARQIFLWLNKKNAETFDVMTDLSKSFKRELKEKFVINRPKCAEHLVSMDGTEKFLWQLEGPEYIETVMIKEGARYTLCLSTQIGCKFKCPFCASGTKRFKRNLTVSEIVGQVIMAQNLCAIKATNIVFMGMGEPLDNYDNVIRSIRIINHPEGIGIGARKITVSTCGIVPGIRKLQNEALQVELSVSLHAPDDATRNQLVPVNHKYPLGTLIPACREYSEVTNRIITLEYILINSFNDSIRTAEKLAKLAKAIRAKVNLIDCSSFGDGEYLPATIKKKKLFKQKLEACGVRTTIRKSKGADILAACGQLSAKFNKA
ncbi:MAG: 23S rRNA (adenine(2503)-C(2))-methyltransferase RlmN [Candidatus Omnitrophota bacterium]